MPIEKYLNKFSEDQIRGLYSQFPDVSDQPELYHSRIKTWQQLISQMIQQEPNWFSKDYIIGSSNVNNSNNNNNIDNDGSSISGSFGLVCDQESFKRALKFRGMEPLSIDDIQKSLMDSKLVTTISSLQSESVSWVGMISSTLFSPLRWGLEALSRPFTGNKTAQESFVFIQTLEYIYNFITDHVLKNHHPMTYWIMDEKNFQQKLLIPCLNRHVDTEKKDEYAMSSSSLSSQEMEFILTYLSNKNVIQYKSFQDHPDKKLIKIMTHPHGTKKNMNKTKNISSSTMVHGIQESDFGIFQIKQTTFLVQSQIQSIETSIQKTDTSIRDYLNRKLQQAAMMQLKKKKGLEQVLIKRMNALDTLEQILNKLDTADTDIQILESYRLGTTTIKKFLKDNQLDVDAVEDAMFDLSETLADQRDIEDAMGLGSANEMISSDEREELEEELDKLLAADLHAKQEIESRKSLQQKQQQLDDFENDELRDLSMFQKLDRLSLAPAVPRMESDLANILLNNQAKTTENDEEKEREMYAS